MRPITLLAVAWCIAVRPPGLASAQASVAEMHRRYVTFEAAAATGAPTTTGPLEVRLSAPALEPDTIPPMDTSRRARAGRFIRAATDTIQRDYALDVVWYAGEVLRPLIPRGVHISVRVQPCREANYFYDVGTRLIVVCYELRPFAFDVASFGEEEAAAGGGAPASDSDVAQVAVGFLEFALLHEAAHAIVHQLALPVLGNDEDAADGFATFALLRSGEGLTAAEASTWLGFLEVRDDEARDGALPDYAAAHPFPAQRAERIRCLLDGADGKVTDERAARCVESWTRLSKTWRNLLTPSR